MVTNLDELYLKQFETRGRPEEGFVASELAFIKNHGARKRDCLILSQRQGIYYAETGLASPMKGAGLVEILLKSDEQNQRERLLSGQFECVFFAIGPYSDPGLKIVLTELLSVYEMVAKNAEGTLLYLRPKAIAQTRRLGVN